MTRPPKQSLEIDKSSYLRDEVLLDDEVNKYQLSLTNPRDALHHGERAANK